MEKNPNEEFVSSLINLFKSLGIQKTCNTYQDP